ncbi:hypothetical protein Bca52824_018202 [Brassica carinata]|uniref:Uncharacterized protein n=1 Tax=Brassica carinata TaxID=52824 RepID=A0A8X7VPN8_BRACI|nr:hypothetical protein Bca52824_018202 [Brassica carinata]
MANPKVFFSDMKSGKCSSVVEARLLRFWEVRNVKRGGELMWVDMVTVDVNEGRLKASSSYSHGTSERGDDEALESLQDRVSFLKVGTDLNS